MNRNPDPASRTQDGTGGTARGRESSGLPEPRLLHTDSNFLLFYKPEDLSFYEDGKKHDLLKAIHRMEEEGRIPPGDRLFPVHRLDRITSGLLLFARGRGNANLLGNEFRHNRVHKIYAALSLHPPGKRHGFIQGDIVKARRGTWKLARTMEQPSRTHFTSRSVPGRRPGLRLFLVKPDTGKTHQVRVILKSIGSPIMGDPLYDRFDAARAEDRTYLHALGISFELAGKAHQFLHPPESGTEFLTTEFLQTLESFGDPFAIRWMGKETPEHFQRSAKHRPRGNGKLLK